MISQIPTAFFPSRKKYYCFLRILFVCQLQNPLTIMEVSSSLEAGTYIKVIASCQSGIGVTLLAVEKEEELTKR